MSISRTIYESLTKPEHKELVNKWEKGDYSFSDHIFGSEGRNIDAENDHPNNHRIFVPLEAEDPIKDHLENAGHTDIDYSKGTVKDKHGRETRIGKALVRTNAHPHIIKRFNDDSARKALGSGSDTHEVIISRHPYDVAGMSTGKRWSSCMDMESGSNKRFLTEEIKNGTHVAYLVPKGVKHDEAIHSPLARIALKQYEAEDSHKILRPSDSYGEANGAFANTVRSWAEKHFPANPQRYDLNKHSYDDGETSYFGGDHKDFEYNINVLHDYHDKMENHPHLTKSKEFVENGERARQYVNGVAANVNLHKLSQETFDKIDTMEHKYDRDSIYHRFGDNPTASMDMVWKAGDATRTMYRFYSRFGNSLGNKENFKKYVEPHIGATGINEHRDILADSLDRGMKLSKQQFDTVVNHPSVKLHHFESLVKTHPEHFDDNAINKAEKSGSMMPIFSHGLVSQNPKLIDVAVHHLEDIHNKMTAGGNRDFAANMVANNIIRLEPENKALTPEHRKRIHAVLSDSLSHVTHPSSRRNIIDKIVPLDK